MKDVRDVTHWGSKYTGYQELVRADEPIMHPRTGIVTGHEKPLIAEFGKFGSEGVVIDPDTGSALIDPGTGRPVGRVATIHGGQWSADEWQDESGASDEEREIVMNALWRAHRKSPTTVWPIEDVKVQPPLPSWGNLSSARKLAIAAELGLLQEALAYEAQEETDPELVVRLEAKIAKVSAEAVNEAALTAA
jgi:hypothetical protein